MKKRTLMIVLMLSVVHFALSAYFGIVILGSTPHVPDSAVYYRQGILLIQGRLFIGNFSREPREAFHLIGSFVKNGNFYFQYNHFWPLLLALPIRLHFAQFFSPLLSAISLILVYLIATKLYDQKSGCIAALFYCVSPLTIILAGDYMTHTATQLFLLAGIYFGLMYVEDPRVWAAFFSGIFLGYAFGLRQLTAIAVAFPVVVYAILFHRKQILKIRAVFFIIGSLIMFVLFLADNYVVNGSAIKVINPIQSSPTYSIISVKNLPIGINIGDSTLAFLPPIIFHNFFPVLFFALVFIPPIVYRKREDFLLLLIFFSLFILYMFTGAMGTHGYGPRYLFEALFALFILASRGVIWVYDQVRGARRIALLLFFAAMLIYNSIGLYTILPMYKNYNLIPSDLVGELRKLDLANSIIIIGQSPHWFNDGITATLYDPNYEKSFFIKELPNKEHEKILGQYPNKTVYMLANNQISLYEWNNSKSHES